MREKPDRRNNKVRSGGITPRVREKLLKSNSDIIRNRITPACAGKTEYPNNNFFVGMGSPPRVREKPILSHFLTDLYRITPACAGKTDKVKQNQGKKKDHPRVCGKNYFLFGKISHYQGSPPRVREKPMKSLTC